MAGSVTLTAKGRKTSPNQLSLPAGSLFTAENVVIRRNDVIEPTRGFKVYGNDLGSVGDRAKQLLVYKDRILRHYNDVLEFDSGEVIDEVQQFEEFDDSDITSVEDGLRIKGVEANGNFYITTGEGIKKISATSADEFSVDAGYITKAGGLKALDLNGYLNTAAGNVSGFLPQDSKVAYRVLWLEKDVNNQLIRGTPSERFEITNSLNSLMIFDFGRLLNALDQVSQASGSKVNDNDYVSELLLADTATASDLHTNLIALAEKLDQEQGELFTSAQIDPGGATIATGVCTFTIDAASAIFGKLSVGDKIWLKDFFVDTTGTINGVQTVSAVTATTFAFSTSAVGTVTSTDGEVESGWFRSITEPEEPSLLPTDDELVALQDYFTAIVTELQSTNNVKNVAQNDGVAGEDPLEIVSSTTTTNIVTINIDTNDPRENLVTNDYVVLGGTWTDDTAVSFAGLQQVDSLTASTIVLDTITLSDGTNVIDATSTIDRVLRFTTAAQDLYLSDFTVTSSATVILNFTIPPDVTDNHFYQVFRSSIAQATGTTVLADLTADDEMQLVYEAYPTDAELAAKLITLEDVTDDEFRGAFLYTNSFSGEGILQANDIPPLSHDIATWRNYVFYANTQTRHRLGLSLLGVSFLIAEATAGRAPKLVIATEETTNIYTFVLGVEERTTVRVGTGGSVAGDPNALASSGTADYFLIYNANDEIAYYVWAKIGTATDPAISGKTGIPVVGTIADTNATFAVKISNTLKTYVNDFTTSVSTHTVTITNTKVGRTTNASAPADFVVTVTVQGVGEDASTNSVLLSEDSSAGQAVDITARSLVRVINKNDDEVISAFYLSGPGDVPGKMLFEGQGLDTDRFYVIADTVETDVEQVGESFSPIIAPTHEITVISMANPTVITSTTHGLLTNAEILVVNSDSTPNVDGIHTITVIDANTFSIDVNVSSAGTQGAFTALADTLNIVQSDNEVRPNRVYYSKVNEPEAVPILNYIDLGPKDKAILRLAPLRDGVLVYKEDGLYRLSGDVAPFVNEVNDSSVIMIAPDSLAIMNNLAFSWTVQGITASSDSGSNIISRDIDTVILPKATFEDFSTLTWGVGYESDNTYRVYTVDEDGDTIANVGFMYNMLTQTWTNLTNSATCGVVNSADDRMYLGAGDINATEQERKAFTRLDYAGREHELNTAATFYLSSGLRLAFTDADDISIGDVIVQEQLLTIYEYNQILKKLDLDLGIDDPTYEDDLEMASGDNSRTKIVELAEKLDLGALSQTNYAAAIDEVDSVSLGITMTNSVADETVITTSGAHGLFTGRVILIASSNSVPDINGEFEVTVIDATSFSIDRTVTVAGTAGSFTTVEEDFRDVSACYNKIIAKLNDDTVVQMSNYDENESTTVQETIVNDVDYLTNIATVDIALPFVAGNLKVYKAIQRVFTYSPMVFDDPLSWKHLRQTTLLFENKNFTRATLFFATDLLPAFVETGITGLGPGIFGFADFGEGFFGGLANSTPSRTLIPRNCARCRYLVVKFEHNIARETFAIFGITIVGNVNVSDRAYRV